MENFLNEHSDKENLFKQKMEELSRTIDGLGKEMDPGIKDTTAYLNLLGFRTTSSCEGHLDERIRFPYIYGDAPYEPAYRWEGEDVIIKNILTKYELNRKNDIFDDGKIEKEYYEQIHNLKETVEYQAWYKTTLELKEKVKLLLEDFNANNPETKLILTPIYPGYRIVADIDHKKLPQEQPKELLSKAQETFKKFESFLKTIYQNS